MNIKCVIFDVDGVLIDTVPYHFSAWKKLFTEQGVNFTMDDYVKKVNGLPRLTGIKNIMPRVNLSTLEKLAAKKQVFFADMVSSKPPSPLPGVLKLLNHLKKKGVLLAAASSSKNAPVLLKNSGLAEFLNTIVGGEDFTKPKPDPELFLIASSRLNVMPSTCVVVEDAHFGIQAGKNAGMKTIGILYAKDALIKPLADYSIHSLNKTALFLKHLSSF